MVRHELQYTDFTLCTTLNYQQGVSEKWVILTLILFNSLMSFKISIPFFSSGMCRNVDLFSNYIYLTCTFLEMYLRNQVYPNILLQVTSSFDQCKSLPCVVMYQIMTRIHGFIRLRCNFLTFSSYCIEANVPYNFKIKHVSNIRENLVLVSGCA